LAGFPIYSLSQLFPFTSLLKFPLTSSQPAFLCTSLRLGFSCDPIAILHGFPKNKCLIATGFLL
jgi:hypothetical protein